MVNNEFDSIKISTVPFAELCKGFPNMEIHVKTVKSNIKIGINTFLLSNFIIIMLSP